MNIRIFYTYVCSIIISLIPGNAVFRKIVLHRTNAHLPVQARRLVYDGIGRVDVGEVRPLTVGAEGGGER